MNSLFLKLHSLKNYLVLAGVVRLGFYLALANVTFDESTIYQTLFIRNSSDPVSTMMIETIFITKVEETKPICLRKHKLI